MAVEVFNIIIENKFEENSTGKEHTLQIIPAQGSTVMPNTPIKSFKLASSDGYIIFKLRCLNREIDINDYIAFDTNDKVQLSVTNNWWRFKIARKQENGSNNGLPVSVGGES